MKIIDSSNQIQIESLLNECKGNLFEYLVTQQLAKWSKSEMEFLLNISADLKKRLQFYEHIVKTYDDKLYEALPILAQKVSKDLIEKKIFSQTNSPWHFSTIGKLTSSDDEHDWAETDIVAINNELGQKKYISLKLTKDHSYTNTKSAGVKSFIEKYFIGFQDSFLKELQNDLCRVVDQSFLLMGHSLYKMADLDFNGKFEKQWTDSYSELPGELSEEMKKIVHENYHRVAIELHSIIKKLHQKSEKDFFRSLESLCGFGFSEMIQVNCIHQNTELKKIEIKQKEELFNTLTFRELVIDELKDQASSFEINFGTVRLQLRIKPMNKFTTASYKVNCSLKYR